MYGQLLNDPNLGEKTQHPRFLIHYSIGYLSRTERIHSCKIVKENLIDYMHISIPTDPFAPEIRK